MALDGRFGCYLELEDWIPWVMKDRTKCTDEWGFITTLIC